MGTLEILNQKSRELGLRFLVVGGHAVIAHGYERQTADLDILVRNLDREAWRSLLSALGYRLFHEQGVFAQFSPVEQGAWPVDLMFVNDQTFDGFFAEARDVQVTGVSLKIPSVEHLLALKFHALKHTHPQREMKDLLDVVNLIEANHIDLNGESFKKLCDRYGTPKIRDQIIAASSR